MRRLVPTNWCFLFYWVFLVNFGPSFHHADLFGLHSHTAGSVHCGLHHSHSHNLGCCDHDHGTDDGHRHPVPQDLEASEALEALSSLALCLMGATAPCSATYSQPLVV